MKPWPIVLTQVSAVAVGWVLATWAKKIFMKLPRWIVLVLYEAPFEGDDINRRQYVFYLREKKEIRGDKDFAKRFWTERAAKAAAAELHLSGYADILGEDATYMSRNHFRFVEIRIARVSGL